MILFYIRHSYQKTLFANESVGIHSTSLRFMYECNGKLVNFIGFYDNFDNFFLLLNLSARSSSNFMVVDFLTFQLPPLFLRKIIY